MSDSKDAAIRQLEFLIDEDSRASERHVTSPVFDAPPCDHCGRLTFARVPDRQRRADHNKRLRGYIRALRILRATQALTTEHVLSWAHGEVKS